MNGNTLEQFKVESDSHPGVWYVVTETVSGEWQCSCVGWTRHTPRRDCKHIRWCKCGGCMAEDPLLRNVEVANHKAARKAARQ